MKKWFRLRLIEWAFRVLLKAKNRGDILGVSLFSESRYGGIHVRDAFDIVRLFGLHFNVRKENDGTFYVEHMPRKVKWFAMADGEEVAELKEVRRGFI